ncbi:hypothetical protein F5Y06DRAFT_279209 [Hypoxylon sp. FL0890]|nr:hypothetical protein F5Y06DRAFT_279209 [Hypoxylon sp. FL0890]
MSYCVVSCIASFIALYVVLVGCLAAGCSYFAAFINNELRPYFMAHGMESESSDAYQAFIYFVVSSVLLWVLFLQTIFNICTLSSSHDHEEVGDKCSQFFKSAFKIAIGGAVLILACLTAKNAWGWWHYFDSQGLDHLAAQCHALAGMITAAMVLSGFAVLCFMGTILIT